MRARPWFCSLESQLKVNFFQEEFLKHIYRTNNIPYVNYTWLNEVGFEGAVQHRLQHSGVILVVQLPWTTSLISR